MEGEEGRMEEGKNGRMEEVDMAQSDGNQKVLKDGGKGGRMEEGNHPDNPYPKQGEEGWREGGKDGRGDGGGRGEGGLYLSIFPAGSSHHFHPCGYLFHTSSYSISLHSSTLPNLPSFHSFILHLDLVDR